MIYEFSLWVLLHNSHDVSKFWYNGGRSENFKDIKYIALILLIFHAVNKTFSTIKLKLVFKN